MKRKLFLITALALCLILALSACGGNSDNNSGLPNSPTSNPANSPSGNPSSSQTDAPSGGGELPSDDGAGRLSGDVKIIPGDNAMDILPENFSITWKNEDDYHSTVTRKDGSWYYSYENRFNDLTYYSAAIIQSDGSFKNYEWDSENTTPIQREWFTSSYATADDLMIDLFDFNGYTESGTLSTWLQMCKDYKAGKKCDACTRFYISDNMVKTGSEVIAGVTCDVVSVGGVFSSQEYSYDPETGMLFRFGSKGSGGGGMTYSFTVTEYTDSPATLGTYPD